MARRSIEFAVKVRHALSEILVDNPNLSTSIILNKLRTDYGIKTTRQTVYNIKKDGLYKPSIPSNAESLAIKQLEVKGFSVEKALPSIYGRGVPDLRVGKKTWIEVKANNQSLSESQAKYIKSLLQKGHKVYLWILVDSSFVKFMLNYSDL